MKARRGKRSEPFWPSIVMKKWLNIAPQLHEFSEDEVDTETESEDDACSRKDEETHVGSEGRGRRMQESQSVCLTHTPGKTSKSYPLKHRRQKSETLRVQYINKKDVRVTICSWNVAGKSPPDDLKIDDWINMQEPADIYIIGFQEVVPLNAGNVFGAEDNRPIAKWEAVIRRTLNKNTQPETKHESYTAPTSPVLKRSSSADDVLTAETRMNALDKDSNRDYCRGSKLFDRKIYNIDMDSRMDWPERSLDTTPQHWSCGSKLRRVLSSSGRVGSARTDKPLLYTPLRSAVSDESESMKRMRHSSGNLGLMWMDQPQKPHVLDRLHDVSELFSEDDDDDENTLMEGELDTLDENGIEESGRNKRPLYVRIVSKQMVGIHMSVWVRGRLRRHVNNLKVSPVGVGLMGYMGNKGSVSVSMSFYQSQLCFVCSHLTSGHKDGNEQRRNFDVHEILRRTRFSSGNDIEQPRTIPSHDQIFWFGDLNYRLNMPDMAVRKLVAKKQWNELINCDQLSNELESGGVFDGWKEGEINFAPTYKYEFNSTRYVGEIPKEGEKKRSPAWCDRILWLGKDITQLSYKRAENTLSDHRPVSSVFVVEVEVFDHRKLSKALNGSDMLVHPHMFLDEDEF